MKIKTKNILMMCCFLAFILGSCGKRNFFPDGDDPGLSRLTSRGYNIATMYINDVPYINTYSTTIFGGISNSMPIVTLIPTNSTSDTLNISWQIEINDNSNTFNQPYYYSVSLLMPVKKNFTSADFLAMDGQRFAANTNAIALNSDYNISDTFHQQANIYFVNLKYMSSSATSTNYYAFSGLFNGNIGNSISITKGRFDFKIDASQIKF